MVQFVRHSGLHCSLTFSLVISSTFPKSRIKLGKQGYLIFWKSQGQLLSLQAVSRGNTLFVKAWLYIANGYDGVSQWAYSWRSVFPFACFPCFMFRSFRPWVTSPVSTGIKIVFLLINPWPRKLKPVNIPHLSYLVDRGLLQHYGGH